MTSTWLGMIDGMPPLLAQPACQAREAAQKGKAACIRWRLLRHSRVNLPDVKPVVYVAKWVLHERCSLVMTPLAVHNELVLVVPAGNRVNKHAGC